MLINKQAKKNKQEASPRKGDTSARKEAAKPATRGNAKQHSLGIIFEELDAELKYKDKMARRKGGDGDPAREKEIYY